MELNLIKHARVRLKENLHSYYPEFINMFGGAKTVKGKLAGAIILDHCWGLLGPSILLGVCLGGLRWSYIEAKGLYTKY